MSIADPQPQRRILAATGVTWSHNVTAKSQSVGRARAHLLSQTETIELQLMLIARIGDRSFAVPVLAVERILRMAAFRPLPQAPSGVAGVLNLHGATLPVVDPRPRLGLLTPRVHPDQHLVLMNVENPYLLWMDRAERMVSIPAQNIDAVELEHDNVLTPQLIRLDGDAILVLAPEAFDPGPIIQRPVMADR
jgi:chemotaxis signal transduction protein